MKVMVIVKASASSEAGVLPSTELLTAMGAYNEELVKAGIMQDGAGLKPSSQGVRVHFSGTSRVVLDGPFTETKELIAGFWLWQVDSMADAIQWVKRCPNPMLEESDIEIRPLYEAADFGDAYTPELREQAAVSLATTVGLPQLHFLDGAHLHLAGIEQRYSFDGRSEIPQQWERFVLAAASLAKDSPGSYYGVCRSSRADRGFDYLTAIEVHPSELLPEEFITVEIEPSRYAVFTHAGHVSTIPDSIDLIWRRWAPSCGLTIADRTSFERYTAEFNAESGMDGVELWIPLENEPAVGNAY